MTETFRTHDVLRFVPTMTYRKLQWLDESGINSPVQVGHARRYSAWDVLQIAVIQSLIQKGISLRCMSSSHKTFSAKVLSKAYASGASVLLVYVPRKREEKRIIKTKFCGPGEWQDIVLNAAQPVVAINVEEVMNKLVYRGVPASCFKEAPKQRAA